MARRAFGWSATSSSASTGAPRQRLCSCAMRSRSSRRAPPLHAHLRHTHAYRTRDRAALLADLTLALFVV
eukprot:2720034-Prymnesium_polylepis.1